MGSLNKKEKIVIGIAIAIIAVLLVVFLAIRFSSKTYIVKFNTNGGSPIESVEVKKNGKVKKPNDPTKEGYNFTGWYYKDKEFDFDTKITEDITLQAYWEENGIGISAKTMSILLGDEKKIEILSLPKGVNMSDLEFSSSDEEIVTVDEKGNLTTLKAGVATITIKTKDGKYSVKVEVTITQEEILPDSIAIVGYSSVSVGEVIRLLVAYEPDETTNTNVTWSSSNPAIAAIDQNGNVRGISEGTVTITAESENGKTATHTVSVYVYNGPSGNDPEPEPIPSNPDQGQQNPEPIPDPTPSEPEVITPVYTIYITARDLGGGSLNTGAVQYDFQVTRDGVALSSDQFKGFTYGGQGVSSKQSSVSSAIASLGNGTAELKLADGTVVTANVVVTN